MKETTWETIKEGLRLIFFGIIATAVTLGAEYFGNIKSTDQTIIVIAFILRLADKWVHSNPNMKLKGLSPV